MVGGSVNIAGNSCHKDGKRDWGCLWSSHTDGKERERGPEARLGLVVVINNWTEFGTRPGDVFKNSTADIKLPYLSQNDMYRSVIYETYSQLIC